MVIDMAIDDARAVIAALAEPETLLVFGVLAVRTSRLRVSGSDRSRSTSYVTPFGLMRETSLSREVVEVAAARLKRAGLVEVLVDDEGGYESWRISEAALAAATTASVGVFSPSGVYDPGNGPVAGTNVTITAC
jgi:DNA-binding transcriptional ArsR family regulator